MATVGKKCFAVRVVSNIAKTRARGHRKLRRVVEPRIVERPLPVHLEVRHESIPMGDGTPPCPCVKVHSGQAKSGRNQSGSCLSIIAEGFAIEKHLGVELAWSPTLKHRANGGLIDTQQVRHGR